MNAPTPEVPLDRLARAIAMAEQGWCVRCEDAPTLPEAALCVGCEQREV
jgi:hypothetical protein